MRKRIFAAILSVTMVASMLMTGCGSDSKSEGKTDIEGTTETVDKKVGCILGVGGLGDQSFNDLIYQGLSKAKDELGVGFDYAEPKQVSDFEVMMRDMASSGEYEVILCVGFDSMDALTMVAAEFEDQKFAFIDGTIDAPNIASYGAKEEEGAFLAGALAGLMKKNPAEYKVEDNNQIGFIAALETPILLKWNAGYQAGAQYVNDAITCKADFVAGDNPFGDTTTAKEIAIAQNNQGADIIFHAAGGSGLGLFDAANEYEFYAIGCNSNQNTINPDVIVASVLKRVDTAAFEIAKSACVDGNLSVGQTVTLGIADTGMDITFDQSNVTVKEEDLAVLETIKQQMIDGTIVVPSAMEDVSDFITNNTFTAK